MVPCNLYSFDGLAGWFYDDTSFLWPLRVFCSISCRYFLGGPKTMLLSQKVVLGIGSNFLVFCWLDFSFLSGDELQDWAM